MPGLRREVLELGVIGISSLRIASSLWSVSGTSWELVGFLCLNAFSAVEELLSHHQQPGFGYDTKPADSEGLALGALTIPWTFTALFITDKLRKGYTSGYSLLACRSTLASAASTLLFLSLRAFFLSRTTDVTYSSRSKLVKSPVPQRVMSPRANRSSQDTLTARLSSDSVDVEVASPSYSRLNRRTSTHPGRNAARFALIKKAKVAMPALGLRYSRSQTTLLGVGGASLLLLLCIPLLHGSLDSGVASPLGHFSSSVGMAMNAALAIAALHLMLKLFPRCFTLGEGMVVAQSLALLLTDTAMLLAAMTASQLHNSPSLFNPPASPGREPHPLLRAQMDQEAGSIPNNRAGSNISRSIHNMILDSIFERENYGKGWLGYNVMPRAPQAIFVQLLVSASLAAAVILIPMMRTVVQKLWHQRQITWHAPMLAGLILLVIAAAVQPALWVLTFATMTSRRQVLLVYWAMLLAAVLPFIHWLSAAHAMPTILVRKGYHLLALLLFLPALLWEPQLLAVSLAIALTLLIVVEIVRLGQVPYFGDKINTFMMSFTDGRDSGMLLVSHFSLLTGMAVPVWLSTVTTTPTTTRRDMTDLVQLTGRDPIQTEPFVSNSSVTALPLTAFAGIMILGIADSAASAIGKKYGKHRICIGTSKTIEGTLGATLLTLLGWALLAIVFQGHMSNSVTAAWDGTVGAKLLISTLLSCLLEASTTQLDNIFMPLHYLAMLSL